MKISYKNLWELPRLTGISSRTIQNMWDGKPVSLDVIRRICEFLDCPIERIVEFDKIQD